MEVDKSIGEQKHSTEPFDEEEKETISVTELSETKNCSIRECQGSSWESSEEKDETG